MLLGDQNQFLKGAKNDLYGYSFVFLKLSVLSQPSKMKNKIFIFISILIALKCPEIVINIQHNPP